MNNLSGHPDIYLAKYKTAIFVHGCFWHRHDGCKFAYIPKSRTGFWTDKFNHNIERDKSVCETLISQGIRCMVVWECTVKKMQKNQEIKAEVLDNMRTFFNSSDLLIEI